MSKNVSFLTGTQKGFGHTLCSRTSDSQVRKGLAEPKAMVRVASEGGGDRSQSRTRDSIAPAKLEPNRLVTEEAAQGQCVRRNPSEVTRSQAVADIDRIIRTTLAKDPKLPGLTSVQRRSVIS